MELLTQWMMAVLFAASPVIGYWLYTLASQEVEAGRSWLFGAVGVAIIAMGYFLLSRQQSTVVILSAIISFGLLAKELGIQKINRLVGSKPLHPLVRSRLVWGGVWFFILLMGFEGLRQNLIEVSSSVIITGLIMGSLVRDRYSTIMLGLVPLILSAFESVI